MSLVTTKLTTEDVRKAVELFWTTFLAKSEEELNNFYAPGSTVFQVAMGRSEPVGWGRCAVRANTSTRKRAWS